MTTSRFLVDINADHPIPEQNSWPHARWRRPARLRGGQCVPAIAPSLIDGLIDRVHLDWPDTSFILALPSGEEVFVPTHFSGPRCAAEHRGYYALFVLPFVRVDPTRGGGRCRMKPVTLDEPPARVPFYEIDLRSGMLVMGAGPTPAPAGAGRRG